MNLQFQYPAWFILLCAALGLGYAMLLYYRDDTFRERLPRLHYILGLLRFLVVTGIAMLLLSPLIKRTITETQKPLIVMAHDHSQSVGLAFDSAGHQVYRTRWTDLKAAFSEQFDVREVAFGDDVRLGVDFQYVDKVSNLSEAMQGIYDLFGGQNLGAVILATDGIYNEGSNPAYTRAPFSAPLYAIALGDDRPQKDLKVKRVFHNKIAYLGDQVNLLVDVAATNCRGNTTVLSVSKVVGDQVRSLRTLPVALGTDDYFVTKEFFIEADQPGVAHYRINLSGIDGETSRENNVRDIFIDVLDARQQILILSNAPHPDLGAMRQALENNKNYAVSIGYVDDPGIQVSKADFVVLHNLPSGTSDISGVLRTLDEKRTPRLYVAGMQTNYGALSKVQGLVTVQSDGQQRDEAQAKVDPGFVAFLLDPRISAELPRFNPITSAFGRFSANPSAQVLLWKRIGKVDTDQPLLTLGEHNGVKTGVLLGEGLWKWRLFDYMQHQNHDIFNELLGKTVQFLSVKEDKRKFRVNLDKSVFRENEAVLFAAELYNDNYERINAPDVSLIIRHTDGREFPFTFNRQGQGYSLNAGILPAGSYTYKAQVTHNGLAHAYEGKFSVQPIQLERFETVANHGVLRQLTERFGGSVVYPDAMSGLVDQIVSNGQLKPVIYQTARTTPLLNLKWLFALLAGLLSLEWFLRRYFGAY
jgi:hypothetical protein